MKTIHAIYENGVFRPLEPVGLPEQTPVEFEPRLLNDKRTLLASELLRSGLVGIWAERVDIGDSREFARRLREQAQNRRIAP